MPWLYDHHDKDLALDALWELLKTKATNEELLQLMDVHPVLAELDECGPNGIVGIGLGNPGGHAV